MQNFDHLHVIISASVRNPPRTVEAMNAWLLDTVDAVDMKVLMGPFSTRCETAGNVGVTGIVVIETSHCSAHCWDECDQPFIKIDLYSCKTFEPDDVVAVIREHFNPIDVTVMVIDRNAPRAEVISQYLMGFPG